MQIIRQGRVTSPTTAWPIFFYLMCIPTSQKKIDHISQTNIEIKQHYCLVMCPEGMA